MPIKVGSRVAVQCFDSDDARKLGHPSANLWCYIQSAAPNGGNWGLVEGTSGSSAKFLLVHAVNKKGLPTAYWAIDAKLF